MAAWPKKRRLTATLRRLGRAGALLLTLSLSAAAQTAGPDASNAQARNEAALTQALQALQKMRQQHGDDNLGVAGELNDVGVAYENLGRWREAENALALAVDMFKRAIAPAPEVQVIVERNYGSVLFVEGKSVEAEAAFQECLRLAHGLGFDALADVADIEKRLSDLYANRSDLMRAVTYGEQAVSDFKRSAAADGVDAARASLSLGTLYILRRDLDQAEEQLLIASVRYEALFSVDSPMRAEPLGAMASLRMAKGDYSGAVDFALRGMHIDPQPRYAALLAGAYAGAGDVDKLPALLARPELFVDPDAGVNLILSAAGGLAIAGKTQPAIDLLNSAAPQIGARFGRRSLYYAETQALLAGPLGDINPQLAHALAKESSETMRTLFGGGSFMFCNSLSLAIVAGYKAGAIGDTFEEIKQLANSISCGDTSAALRVIDAARRQQIASAVEAFNLGLRFEQRGVQSAAAAALNQAATRLAAGAGALADLVRVDQNLAIEEHSLSGAFQLSYGAAQQEASPGRELRERIELNREKREATRVALAAQFPSYAAFAHPEPLELDEIQSLLDNDEALIVLRADEPYAWAATKQGFDARFLPLAAQELAEAAAKLRTMAAEAPFLSPLTGKAAFDPNVSFALYRKLIGPIEPVIRGKRRLTFVLDGVLTGLPPQLLVVSPPRDSPLRDVDWLIKSHAVTVLPSVASLKSLRAAQSASHAQKPLIGFANPVFDPKLAARSEPILASVQAAQGDVAERKLRGGEGDIRELEPLPQSETELRKVAASVHARDSDLRFAASASVTEVKRAALDDYRIVYFATHGLMAGQAARYEQAGAEPALVLTTPVAPNAFDDGLLKTSDVLQLKLDAEWVVMSACDTAAGGEPGAEPLSGLARAFFYAGGRSLLVSNWAVDTDAAATLMADTFAAATDPRLSHAEALQSAMLKMIGDPDHPQWADPFYWAPFSVIGEPAKPAAD